jgi:hypothetical protein
VIGRIWRGATRREDAGAYVEYLKETGLKEYRETSGNQGAWAFWREVDGKAEFLAISLWGSRDDVVAFAGEDIDRAVFYPEDDRFLVERDVTVNHYEVETG